MKITKIIIGVSILFLLIGAATATQYNNLKAPSDYKNMAAGTAEKLDNKEIYFYVGEMELNKGIFDNTSDVTVTPLGDNIYQFKDTRLDDCGVQEKVKIDSKEYLVSIVDESSSNGNINQYLNDLKSFNQMNNLKPLPV